MSGRKNVLSSYPIIGTEPNSAVAGDMSASFNIFLKPTHVEFLDNVGILVNWTTAGSPVGVLHVWVSDDKGNTDPNSGRVPTEWYELDFGSPILINSSEDRHVININQQSFTWIAVSYERTGGTGTMTARMTVKEV